MLNLYICIFQRTQKQMNINKKALISSFGHMHSTLKDTHIVFLVVQIFDRMIFAKKSIIEFCYKSEFQVFQKNTQIYNFWRNFSNRSKLSLNLLWDSLSKIKTRKSNFSRCGKVKLFGCCQMVCKFMNFFIYFFQRHKWSVLVKISQSFCKVFRYFISQDI